MDKINNNQQDKIEKEEKEGYICDGFSCRPVNSETSKEQFKDSSSLSMKINIFLGDDCK